MASAPLRTGPGRCSRWGSSVSGKAEELSGSGSGKGLAAKGQGQPCQPRRDPGEPAEKPREGSALKAAPAETALGTIRHKFWPAPGHHHSSGCCPPMCPPPPPPPPQQTGPLPCHVSPRQAPEAEGYHVLQAHLVLQLVLEQARELAFARRSGLQPQHGQDTCAGESQRHHPRGDPRQPEAVPTLSPGCTHRGRPRSPAACRRRLRVNAYMAGAHQQPPGQWDSQRGDEGWPQAPATGLLSGSPGQLPPAMDGGLVPLCGGPRWLLLSGWLRGGSRSRGHHRDVLRGAQDPPALQEGIWGG